MNVKTLKRFSRRSVSMLLSVLMVVSLFTVCMVGTSITASARNLASSTIKVTLTGAAADWEEVYFVVGQENSGGEHPYVKFIKMSKVANTDSTYSASDVSFTNYDRAFFAGTRSFVKDGTTYTASGTSPNYSITDHKIDSTIIPGIAGVYRTEDMDNIEWKAESSGGSVSGSNITFGEMSSKEYAFSFKSTDVITAVRTSSTKDWENVYLVVGNGSSTKVVQMSPTTTPSTVSTPLTTSEKDISFSPATSYFFTDVLPGDVTLTNGVGTVSSSIDTVYKSIPKRTIISNEGTPQEVTSHIDRKTEKYSTKPTGTVELKINMPDYINATLYNYRSGSRDNDDGSGGQIPATAKTTAIDNYVQDTTRDDSTGHETNYRPFYKYNKAVQAWYSSKDTSGNYTPLYAGNFKDIDGGYASTIGTTMGLTHFIGLANWAEKNAKSVAVGLVDDKMHNGTVTQNGVEIPQFSDAFMKANPTLQSKYSDLLFEVNKTEDSHGNEWYSYDANTDGNRYLDYTVGTGTTPSTTNNVLTKGDPIPNPTSGEGNGFFPFNKTNNNLVKCFGVKFEVKFSMPAGGKANSVPLQFNFSGDDDLWVYIDDYLILDMSGAHARVDGSIDLSHSINATTGKPEGSIKGIIRSDSYKNTTWEHMAANPKENNYDLQYSSTTWGTSSDPTAWVTPTTVDGKKVGRTFEFDSNTEAFKQITKTTEEHTMTIFYMERGLYDSNLSFSFMLPQNNTLTLKQDVDNKNVNQGLKRATMDVANKDVFYTRLEKEFMDAVTDNIVEYPIENNFTRLSPSQSTTDTPVILQEAKTVASATASNSTPAPNGYKDVEAAYAWKDASTLIDKEGNYTTTAAAENQGVGLPQGEGNVPLLYGQSATFYDQFLTYPADGDLTKEPIIRFGENTLLYKFVRGTANANTGLYTATPTTRDKGTYYSDSFAVVDGKGGTIATGYNGTEFKYWNADKSTNKVDITIGLNHVIKVGSISVKKEVDNSITSETTPNLTKEYKFKAEYIELFGDLDNTYDTNKDDDSKWTTMQRVKYTLTKKDGNTEPNQTIPYEGTDAGIFTLKEGETATITGIPVGTVVRVKEMIETDAEYEVKDITDGSGNELTNSTTKVVEKPMFITEGIKDNTTYSYIIKNGLAIQTASLVVNTKVTTTGVNSGIATELEEIFNNDVFGYKVQTNSKKVSTNPAKLPITSDFTRTKGDGTTSDTLQAVTSTTGTKGNTGSTNKTLTGMDAYYTWTDTSGRATGSGVGVPVDNTYNVHLQYDQTATFDSQIALDKDSTEAGANPVKVNVEQAPKTYTNGANTGTGGTRLANIDNNRTVADLYTTTYNITGASSTNGTAAQPKNASQLSENENVVIEYTFTNAVKFGQIKVSKTVTDGSDANINPNGSYEFTLTYHTLFGKSMGSDVPAAGWEGIISPSGHKIITDGTGKFSIKKGETVTFAGVPVQTDYKVTEVIPTGAKYAVKGASLKINDVASDKLTRNTNVCTIKDSLTNSDDVSAVTVDNTYSTVPVLYRYHNRVNQNGYVTHLQGTDEWTYFVKYVDGTVASFIDGSGNIKDDAKIAIVAAMPTIDNVLASYALTSASDFDFHKLSADELARTISDDTAAKVGYKASIQALNANGNFYDGNKVILATIKNTARTYPVTVTYFKADPYNSTTKVNPMAEASTGVPEATVYEKDCEYNEVVTLDATITRLMLDDPNPTSNESIGKYLFAYWERQVTYQSVGSATETKWVPVSTNYQYSYKVVNPTTIRAVYRATKAEADGTYKRYHTEASGLVEDGTFTPLENGSTQIPAYTKVPKPHYTIYWQTEAGSTEKKYKNSSGDFTIDASTATTALNNAVAQSSADPLIAAGLYYTVETEYKAEYVIDQNDTVSLPENGFDAAATDKVINPYVKQVGNTAQDRAVFDIVFGDVGAKDRDSQIQNVGYILFYGNNYIDTSDTKVSESALKSIANGAAVGTENRTDASLYPGSGRCRVAKYQAITSGTPGTNQVKITNKNRVDLIIDVINNETSRNKFYTCYTYMIRKEDGVDKVYVSDTPITFSPSEITLGGSSVTPTVETAYNLAIENYYQKNDGAYTVGGKNYTKANDYGYVLSNAYTFANGKTLTLTVRPLQQGIYRGKLVELHHGNGQITVPEEVQNGEQMTYTFNTSHIPEADGNTLKLKAYFDPTLVGAKFTLEPKHGIEFKVYFDDGATPVYTVNETTGEKEVIAPYGTKIRVDAQTIKIRVGAQTILNDDREGYAITDATKGSFDLADDSTRTKSQMATKEVTVTTGMTSEQLATEFANLPTATPLYYTVTAQQARGTYGATLNYTGGVSASTTTEATQTATVGTSVPASTTLYVWQGNPVITLSDTSGNYVLTAGTNTSISGNTITVADTGAVVSIGGYAPLTLSPVANATTVVTVNGNDTTIDTANQVVDVPYNYDETTGTDVTVTVTADTGYVISNVKNYTKSTPKVAAKTVTLTNNPSVLTDTDLTNLPDVGAGYVLTINAGTGGSVTISGTDVYGTVNGTATPDNSPRTYTVLSGTVFTLSAVAGSNYTFNNWTGALTSTTATGQTVTVDSDKTITANFVETYTLSVTAGANGSVTVTKPDNSIVDVSAGNTQTFTVRSDATNKTFTLNAIADTDYHFVKWTGDLTGTTATGQQITLDGNKSVTASFEANGITVTLDVSKTLSGGKKWSYTGDGAHIYVFYAKASNYNDNGWIQMTETSTDIYSALIPNGYTKVIFVRTTNGEWSGAQDQSPTGTNVYHTISETDTAWKVMDWKNSVKKLVTKTVTLNANSSVNWTADSAVIKLKYNDGNQDVTIPMENTSGSIYSATITFPEGNEDITFQRVNPNNAGQVWDSASANISSTVNWQVTDWSSVGAA